MICLQQQNSYLGLYSMFHNVEKYVDLAFLLGNSFTNFTVPTSHERQKEMVLGLRAGKHTTPLPEDGKAKKRATKQSQGAKAKPKKYGQVFLPAKGSCYKGHWAEL